jgi:hypothetical protein
MGTRQAVRRPLVSHEEAWNGLRGLIIGRSQVLSLTLFSTCCIVKTIVCLSDTEGAVPPSAFERGVTNR